MSHDFIIHKSIFLLLIFYSLCHFNNVSTGDGKCPGIQIQGSSAPTDELGESLLRKYIFDLLPPVQNTSDQKTQVNLTLPEHVNYNASTILKLLEESLKKKPKPTPDPYGKKNETEMFKPLDHGYVAYVGDSVNDTMPPYLAAQSAIHCGAQISYIFSTMDFHRYMINHNRIDEKMGVYPYLDHPQSNYNLIDRFLRLMSSVVFGSGLTTNQDRMRDLHFLVNELIHNSTKPPVLIFDGDSINFVCHNKEMLRHYKGDIYLTPNSSELKWLKDAFPRSGHAHKSGSRQSDNEHLKHIALNINPNATIIVKGPFDKIITPKHVAVCTVEGTIHRPPGQGALLAGALNEFAYKSKKFTDKFRPGSRIGGMTDFPNVLAAYAACTMTRLANKLAFEQEGKDMNSSHVMNHFKSALEMEKRAGTS